jgi:hypothetical protein
MNIANDIKLRDKPNDVFYTPIEVVKIHLEFVKPYIKKGFKIYDPFFGKGAYFNLFETHFPECKYDWTEISLGKDFFNYNKECDAIISNPPFSIFDKVLEKCVSLKPSIISLIFGVLNLTPKRIGFMEQNEYKLVGYKLINVYGWFSQSILLIFSKTGTPCISYVRQGFKQESVL